MRRIAKIVMMVGLGLLAVPMIDFTNQFDLPVSIGASPSIIAILVIANYW